jgi:ubiquinone/menaquinone biosynthesis C-methylase UbiE
MHDDGYKNITNIDISKPCIDQMQQRRPELKYQVLDATDMRCFQTGQFDFALDKSTIDALCCSDHAHLDISKILKEVQRVLKPGGLYIIVSFGVPVERTLFF